MSKKKKHREKLDEFLQKYKTKEGEESTHLRIPNVNMGVYGGKWCIKGKEALKKFCEIYHHKVFELGLPEYLTETQDRINGGPIMLDLDFKYFDIKERQHDGDIVNDIIECYLQHLSELIDTSKGFEEFTVWTFEKDDINILKDAKQIDGEIYNVKDGIHMIWEIIMPHDMQLLLRDMVLTSIEDEVFEALRPQLVNNADDIIDKSISSGSTGVQMYGSKKPGSTPYKLTGSYRVGFNKDISQFQIKLNANQELIEKTKSVKHLPLYFSTRTKFKNYKRVEINKQLETLYVPISSSRINLGTTFS